MTDNKDYALQKDDLIHAVSVSSPLPTEQKHHTVHIILLAICRAMGVYDVLIIFKTLHGRQEVQQQIQAQIGIQPGDIAASIEVLKARYSEQIAKSENKKIRWSDLALDHQLSRNVQLTKIQKWGKANVGTGIWRW